MGNTKTNCDIYIVTQDLQQFHSQSSSEERNGKLSQNGNFNINFCKILV